MSKFHSTVTRRDFMKGIGLAGAGLGAAAATTPVFRDLDELTAASNGVSEKWPWWVKSVDKPTVEIDWQLMNRFNFLTNFAFTVYPPDNAQLGAAQLQHHDDLTKSKQPGFTLRDRALCAASWLGSSFGPEAIMQPEPGSNFLGEFGGPEPKVPRWEASPEENTRTIRSALKHFGAAEIGVVELDSNVRSKLIYDVNFFGQKVDFREADKGYVTPTEMVIPDKCRWAISFNVVQSEELTKRSSTALGSSGWAMGYTRITQMGAQLHEFLRGLGYTSVGSGMLYTPIASYGIMSGLGEFSRLNFMVSPNHGALVRCPEIMITDLPLEPTKPIDAGLKNFCETCEKCADLCPTGSLPTGESTWDCATGAWNMSGIKGWKVNYQTCYQNGWLDPDRQNGCGICQGVCVFNKKDLASIHPIVLATVGTTSIFNGFFRNMDDLFDYGLRDEATDSWWDLNVPPNFDYCPTNG